MSSAEIIAQLQSAVPAATYTAGTSVDADLTPTILVGVDHLLDTCRVLQQAPGLEFVAFSDVTAADFYPRREPRFDLVYHFVSPHRRARVRLKVAVDAGQEAPSIISIWPGAGWPEREIYDLFGIVFAGHDDLRRLLMPEDWEGHPLRKDYPVQVRKNAQTFMPLQMTEQEFRANLERDRYTRVRTEPVAAPPTEGSPSENTAVSRP